MTGCSAKTPAAQSTSGNLHIYAGTSSGQTGGASDQWLLKFDDPNKYYYFYDLSDTQTYGLSNSPTAGNYTAANGIIDIANPGASDLYAVELPGEAAAFVSPTFPNPVDGIYPSVTAVTAASDKCSSFKGNNTFNFLVLQSAGYPASGEAPPVYGSVQATSTVDATTGTVSWAFKNLTVSPLGGPASSLGSAMNAVCVVSPTVAGNTILTTSPFPVIAISPSGALAWSDNVPVGGVAGGSPGYAGLIQPNTPVDTSKFVAGKYAGIAIIRSVPQGGSISENGQPVAFGPAAAGGTGLSGGFFPMNDLTQTPSGIQIDLGTQDTKNNGLYQNAIVTLNGQALSAVAVAGVAGNKNLVFVAVPGTPNKAGVLYLFLYGQ